MIAGGCADPYPYIFDSIGKIDIEVANMSYY